MGMDTLLMRFLKKIGIADLTPFEQGSFAKLENDKENNRIIATLHFPKYLSVNDYVTFFDTINNFISHGGFTMRLSWISTRKNSRRRCWMISAS